MNSRVGASCFVRISRVDSRRPASRVLISFARSGPSTTPGAIAGSRLLTRQRSRSKSSLPVRKQEEIQSPTDLVSYPTKRFDLPIDGSFGRIVESPMNRRGSRKYWAMLLRAITDRDHIIDLLVRQLRNILRPVLCNINSDFFHDRHSSRMQPLRMCSGAKYFKSFASHLPKQSLRHLASRGISGA